MTEDQKKDFLNKVVIVTLSALSDNLEALDHLVNAAYLHAIAYGSCDVPTALGAIHQGFEDLEKAKALIVDDVIDICFELGFFKEDK